MGPLEGAWGVLAALLPSLGLLYLFWVIMKHILEGDRRERAAQRLWEAERADHEKITDATSEGENADS